ncbi:MAG TPA: lectin-like protein [Kofleriaceae bacterium]
MTGRAAFAVLLVAGCGAQLGPGSGDDNGQTPDAKTWRDAGVDAPIDARPCMGGTMAQVGPDNSCFVFIATPMTYVNAKAACVGMSAHLAYLKSAALDAFAEQFVGSANTWIGLTDRATEGTFVWDDGTALGFSNWHAGEPNSGGTGATYQEDCAIIAGARIDKQWDDRPCDASEVTTSGMFATLCNY